MDAHRCSRVSAQLARRSLGAALGYLALAVSVQAGQGAPGSTGPASGFGAPCSPGQFALGGYLLVCSSTGTFRYALPEDVPAAPEGGYIQRPSWYPPLADQFR